MQLVIWNLPLDQAVNNKYHKLDNSTHYSCNIIFYINLLAVKLDFEMSTKTRSTSTVIGKYKSCINTAPIAMNTTAESKTNNFRCSRAAAALIGFSDTCAQ